MTFDDHRAITKFKHFSIESHKGLSDGMLSSKQSMMIHITTKTKPCRYESEWKKLNFWYVVFERRASLSPFTFTLHFHPSYITHKHIHSLIKMRLEYYLSLILHLLISLTRVTYNYSKYSPRITISYHTFTHNNATRMLRKLNSRFALEHRYCFWIQRTREPCFVWV